MLTVEIWIRLAHRLSHVRLASESECENTEHMARSGQQTSWWRIRLETIFLTFSNTHLDTTGRKHKSSASNKMNICSNLWPPMWPSSYINKEWQDEDAMQMIIQFINLHTLIRTVDTQGRGRSECFPDQTLPKQTVIEIMAHDRLKTDPGNTARRGNLWLPAADTNLDVKTFFS